jgi:hypothetical protein
MVCLGNMCVDTLHKGENDDDNNNNNNNNNIILFYVLLTVHLDAILGNEQLDALFLNVFIFMPLHVSSSKCSSSGGPNCLV